VVLVVEEDMILDNLPAALFLLQMEYHQRHKEMLVVMEQQETHLMQMVQAEVVLVVQDHPHQVQELQMLLVEMVDLVFKRHRLLEIHQTFMELLDQILVHFILLVVEEVVLLVVEHKDLVE
jgi:hypothetical protein